MKIDSGCSVQPDTEKAANECCAAMGLGPEDEVSWLLVFHSDRHDSGLLVQTLAGRVKSNAVHGGTSCMGVMSAQGFHSENGYGLGLLAITDPDGSYGVGACSMGKDPKSAAAIALEYALTSAGRSGEVPALVWVNAAPGHEEAVLEGIEEVLGPNVPVAGGSTADNSVSGHWRQIAGSQIFDDAVVVSALFPSVEIASAFHSGYDPTGHHGTVTRAEGRTLIEIDGRPAAEVYNAWTDGLIGDVLPAGGNVLARTTLCPLGREVGRVGAIPYYKLSHPDQVTPSGALTLFADIAQGDQIVLMEGSRESLIARAGRVTRAAISAGEFSSESLRGGIVIYCAGCMLTIQDDMDEVAAEIGNALNGMPFLGVFTFGEQGCFIGQENSHGNLMISVVALSDSPAY